MLVPEPLSDERIAELDAAGMGFFYASSVAPRISVEAARLRCIDHPDAPFYAGFGYAGGGGLGSYQRCRICHVVFAKRSNGDQHAPVASAIR